MSYIEARERKRIEASRKRREVFAAFTAQFRKTCGRTPSYHELQDAAGKTVFELEADTVDLAERAEHEAARRKSLGQS